MELISKKFNHYTTLANKGILPSNTKKVSASLVKKTLTEAYGLESVDLTCVKGEHGDQYLQAVRLCLDKNYQAVDCHKTKSGLQFASACAGEFFYPVKGSSKLNRLF